MEIPKEIKIKNEFWQKVKRADIIYCLLAVLPLILTLLAYPSLPQTIPVHYGGDGLVNRWGSRNEILILPLISIVFALLFKWMPKKFDGYKSTDETFSNKKVMCIIGYVLITVFNALTLFFLYAAMKQVTNLNNIVPVVAATISFDQVLTVILSLLYIILGNYLPKCKPNPVVGIRTPWTLDSDEVWYKTHRFGGKLTIICGILSLGLCFVIPSSWALAACGALLLVSCIVEVAYSYRISSDNC